MQLDLIYSQDKLSIGLILQPILTPLEDVITSYHLILAYDAIISDSSFKELEFFFNWIMDKNVLEKTSKLVGGRSQTDKGCKKAEADPNICNLLFVSLKRNIIFKICYPFRYKLNTECVI